MNRLDGYRFLVLASTWLLTFAVHATVAHAVAIIAAKALVRAPRFRGVLWKATLLLPLVSATAATAGWRQLAVVGEVKLPELGNVDASTGGQRILVEERVMRNGGGKPESISFTTNSRALNIAWSVTLLSLGGSLFGMIRLFSRQRAFRRRLGVRTRIVACDGTIAAPYRLSASTTLGAPVAIGINEICVPAATFALLTPAERQSVLAHERAHLARRDPIWFAIAAAVVALFPWLPLLRPAVRRLRRDAEFCCDDAVTSDHERLALVRSLAAFGAEFDPAETALAASCGGSPLEERARRILAPRQPVQMRHAFGLGLALLLVLAAVAGAAPVVSTRTTTDRRPPIVSGVGAMRKLIIVDTRTVNRH